VTVHAGPSSRESAGNALKPGEGTLGQPLQAAGFQPSRVNDSRSLAPSSCLRGAARTLALAANGAIGMSVFVGWVEVSRPAAPPIQVWGAGVRADPTDPITRRPQVFSLACARVVAFENGVWRVLGNIRNNRLGSARDGIRGPHRPPFRTSSCPQAPGRYGACRDGLARCRCRRGSRQAAAGTTCWDTCRVGLARYDGPPLMPPRGTGHRGTLPRGRRLSDPAARNRLSQTSALIGSAPLA
jgi:hypothetical protein